MWFRKQEIVHLHSNEYEELIKRVVTLEARLNSIELENVTLRNKVLRKIQQHTEEIETGSKENSPFVKTKSLNTFSPFG